MPPGPPGSNFPPKTNKNSTESGKHIFFGYFSTVGRISTVVGPFLYFGAVGLANQRAGVFIISILILLGTILLKWPFLLRIKDDD